MLQPGLLEPCAVKVACTVLRGGWRGDTLPLPDTLAPAIAATGSRQPSRRHRALKESRQDKI